MIKNYEDVHELKLDPGVLERHIDSELNFQVRYDNRGYRSGDFLWLRETVHSADEMAEGAPLLYSGWEALAKVHDIMRGPRYGIKEDWVVLSLDREDFYKRNLEGREVSEDEAGTGPEARCVEQWPDGKWFTCSCASRPIREDRIPKGAFQRVLYRPRTAISEQ